MTSNVNHQQKGYVRRAIKKKEPKRVETVKTAMILKAQKTSQTIKQVLVDLSKLKTQDTIVKYNKKNAVRPFDDATPLEYFSEKSDASLFAFGSHSDKKPDNLVVGRFFNHKMLDMVEFGVHDFKSMQSFKEAKHNLASRTCAIFQGEEFQNDGRFKQIANILLDFFVEQPTEFVNLACLDHVLVFTVKQSDKEQKNTQNDTNNENGDENKNSNKMICVRHYAVVLKKSGSRIPRIELTEIGPSMDLSLRRHRFASEDLRQQANSHFTEKKTSSKKNVSKDVLHQQMGTIHIGSQNLGELQQKRPKALRSRKIKDADQEEGGEEQQRKRVKKSED